MIKDNPFKGGIKILLLLLACAVAMVFCSCQSMQERTQKESTAAEKQTEAVIQSNIIVAGHVVTVQESKVLAQTLTVDDSTMKDQQAVINKETKELNFWHTWGLRVGIAAGLFFLFIVYRVLAYFKIIP